VFQVFIDFQAGGFGIIRRSRKFMQLLFLCVFYVLQEYFGYCIGNMGSHGDAFFRLI